MAHSGNMIAIKFQNCLYWWLTGRFPKLWNVYGIFVKPICVVAIYTYGFGLLPVYILKHTLKKFQTYKRAIKLNKQARHTSRSACENDDDDKNICYQLAMTLYLFYKNSGGPFLCNVAHSFLTLLLAHYRRDFFALSLAFPYLRAKKNVVSSPFTSNTFFLKARHPFYRDGAQKSLFHRLEVLNSAHTYYYQNSDGTAEELLNPRPTESKLLSRLTLEWLLNTFYYIYIVERKGICKWHYRITAAGLSTSYVNLSRSLICRVV